MESSIEDWGEYTTKKDLTKKAKIEDLENIKLIFKAILFEFALSAFLIFIVLAIYMNTAPEDFLVAMKWIIISASIVMVICLISITILSSKIIDLLKKQNKEVK